MGTVTGGGQFEDGAQASINATAKPGYHFDSWSDGRNQPSRTIVVHGDMELTATFVEDEPEDEEEYVTLTLNTNVDFADTPTGGGTFVKGATTFISAAEEATDPSKSGNEAVFTFSSWSDGVTSRERNIVLDSDMTLTANYVNPYDYGDYRPVRPTAASL